MKKKILTNKIGIFQGRLTDSKKLQNYPVDWKKEIFISKLLSFSYVEFFLEEYKNNKNPFWSKKGRNDINHLIKKNFNLNKFFICDNYLIKNCLYENKTYFYLKKILENLKDFDNSVLVLPLKDYYFDDISCLSNYFQKLLKKRNNKINISFETSVKADKIIAFLKLLNEKNCGITFDTGNIYLKNFSITKFFKSIKNYINHIHIKDRNYRGDNVQLGEGLINFKNFFDLLKKEKYNNHITLETYRKNNSIATGIKNLQFINSLI